MAPYNHEPPPKEGHLQDSVGSSSSYDYYDSSCCPGVADPLTLLSVLGTMAAATLFLRQAIIRNIAAGGRKRRSANKSHNTLMAGLSDYNSKSYLFSCFTPSCQICMILSQCAFLVMAIN